MPDPELKVGARCRLKHDPGRIGVLTGRSRSPGAFTKLQIQFPEGAQFVPEDQLEALPDEEDALDLLQRGRLGDELDLRLTLAHARLTGRLADVIYSMDVTGTDFYAHQFKPVVRLLNSVARGILIADEVGLGKTIEAGLLWTELRTRYDFRRLLVLCPAVLREKWQRELKNRFGVDAEILDARGTLNRLRQAANDETPSFAIIASLQGLRPRKRWRETTDHVAASKLARFLMEREHADPLIDMCVVDEAHHLRNRETTTSQLARLARTVSDYIVLLTATPIHLRSNDLHELLRLVDEGMFDRGQSFSELLEANAPLVRARELVVGGAPSAAASLPEHLELELRNANRNPLLQDNRQLKRLLDERVWTTDFSTG
ncbi:MAG: DEAD/DEAH box helicase [Acidobacteria bacterium]|nr:DEAD/DEAH box helicase [Acidobacteriota bacterium]